MKKDCNKNAVLVCILFFLYKCGDAMLDVTIRTDIPTAVCERNFPVNVSDCFYRSSDHDIEKISGYYLILYRLAINIPGIVLGLFCGAFADRHGRKLPMVIPSIGSILGVTAYITSLLYQKLRIELLLCGATIQGLCGKTAVITMAVYSYIHDITTLEERIQSIGSLVAANFLGWCIGSLLAGILLEIATTLFTYCTVIFWHGGFILLTLTFLTESVKAQGKIKGESKLLSLFKLTNIKDSIRVLTKRRDFNGRTIVLILFSISFINQLCNTGDQDVTVLFVRKPPFSWPNSWFGYLMSAKNFVMAVTLLFFLPFLSNYLKFSDGTILIFGLSCKIIRLVWLPFASVTWMVFMSEGVSGFSGMVNPATRSLLSKSVGKKEVGKIFSLIASIDSVSKILGDVTLVNLYSWTANYFAGAAYLFEAGLFVILLICAVCVFKKLKKRESQTNVEQNVVVVSVISK